MHPAYDPTDGVIKAVDSVKTANVPIAHTHIHIIFCLFKHLFILFVNSKRFRFVAHETIPSERILTRIITFAICNVSRFHFDIKYERAVGCNNFINPFFTTDLHYFADRHAISALMVLELHEGKHENFDDEYFLDGNCERN